MKTRFLLLALFLALLTGCAQQAPSPTPLTATATPRTPTQRLAAAIPGSYPVIIGGYAVAVLPDYYADRPKKCMNGWGEVFMPTQSAATCFWWSPTCL